MTHPYAAAVLRNQCAAVAAAPVGTRNGALNTAALRVGHYVPAYLGEREATDQLVAAGLAAGLEERETHNTVASGLGKGMTEPKVIPHTTMQAAPTTAPTPVGPYVDWVAEWDKPCHIDWLVEPLLASGRGTVIYSEAKVGKSLLALELAASLATGRSVVGVDTEGTDVLYVDHENQLHGDTISRLKAMGFKATDLARLHLMSFPVMPALDTEAGGATVLGRVHDTNSKYVIFDTASRTISGKENENDTWLNWYRHTGKPLKAAGVGYARLDHTGKDPDKGQRGGSAKSGDVDSIWSMTVRPEDPDLLVMKLEASRFVITETELVIRRSNEPLCHTIQANGRRAIGEAVEKQALNLIRELGLKQATNSEIGCLLREAGLRFNQNKITDWKLRA